MNRTQGETVLAGPVSIRRACVADWAAVADFFAGLSARTRYLRFFGALTLSTAMLRVLSGGGDADVVVASCGGEIIGHGIATGQVNPGAGPVIEMGVVVADAWQGRGIGSALVRALIGAARSGGAMILAMDVLHANHPVLAMIAKHWPAASVERSADCVTFHVRLARPAATSPLRQDVAQLRARLVVPARTARADAVRS
jgi:GNAT superfamily N-acetyltransferase